MVKYNKKHERIQLNINRENAIDIMSLKQLMLIYPQSIIV